MWDRHHLLCAMWHLLLLKRWRVRVENGWRRLGLHQHGSTIFISFCPFANFLLFKQVEKGARTLPILCTIPGADVLDGISPHCHKKQTPRTGSTHLYTFRLDSHAQKDRPTWIYP